MSVDFSIVVFAYNEVDGLERTVLRALEALDRFAKSSSEIIIVDDGSTDGMGDVARALQRTHPRVKVSTHETNRGIGEALRTGYAAATGDFVCAICGDGQFDPHEIADAAPFSDDEIVSFYRTSNEQYSPWRKVVSRANRAINATLVGVRLRDVNWCKVHPGKRVRALRIELRSSLVESELVAKLVADGCRVREVPSRYLPRLGGKPKGASWPVLRRALKETAKLIVVSRRHRMQRR